MTAYAIISYQHHYLLRGLRESQKSIWGILIWFCYTGLSNLMLVLFCYILFLGIICAISIVDWFILALLKGIVPFHSFEIRSVNTPYWTLFLFCFLALGHGSTHLRGWREQNLWRYQDQKIGHVVQAVISIRGILHFSPSSLGPTVPFWYFAHKPETHKHILMAS